MRFGNFEQYLLPLIVAFITVSVTAVITARCPRCPVRQKSFILFCVQQSTDHYQRIRDGALVEPDEEVTEDVANCYDVEDKEVVGYGRTVKPLEDWRKMAEQSIAQHIMLWGCVGPTWNF